MPGEPPQVEELERFLAERGERLLCTAILLAGSQEEEGKDLLQAALERVFRHWRGVTDGHVSVRVHLEREQARRGSGTNSCSIRRLLLAGGAGAAVVP